MACQPPRRAHSPRAPGGRGRRRERGSESAPGAGPTRLRGSEQGRARTLDLVRRRSPVRRAASTSGGGSPPAAPRPRVAPATGVPEPPDSRRGSVPHGLLQRSLRGESPPPRRRAGRPPPRRLVPPPAAGARVSSGAGSSQPTSSPLSHRVACPEPDSAETARHRGRHDIAVMHPGLPVLVDGFAERSGADGHRFDLVASGRRRHKSSAAASTTMSQRRQRLGRDMTVHSLVLSTATRSSLPMRRQITRPEPTAARITTATATTWLVPLMTSGIRNTSDTCRVDTSQHSPTPWQARPELPPG